jgi:uncharacterized protein (DUF1501 family)
MNRRKFVQLSALGSASLFVPGFVKAFAAGSESAFSGRKLIVLQLSGGNDGLNTVIPVRNDIYYRSRPVIGIRREDALTLTDEFGLNPALKNLKGLYDNGSLCLLNGVGYEQPNRSHFRSMDIWQSGSRSDEIRSSGWIGRYLDIACKDCLTHSTMAVEVDDSLSLSMKGVNAKALAIRDPKQFYSAAHTGYFNAVSDSHAAGHQDALPDYLYRTLRETISSASYIYGHVNAKTPAQTYPDTAIGKRMKMIATLILSGADTKIFYASHGSFDTHVGQRGRQDKLLGELDAALAAFTAEMQAAGMFKDVLIMTFSEFGRRVGENASGGTDHGTAAPMFMISGALKKPGMYNPFLDLANLDEGDLRYTLDFRSVYATVLGNWLNTPYDVILGSGIEPLTFL